MAVLYATFMKSTMLLTARIITCNTLLQYEDTSAFGMIISLNITKKRYAHFGYGMDEIIIMNVLDIF